MLAQEYHIIHYHNNYTECNSQDIEQFYNEYSDNSKGENYSLLQLAVTS